VNKIVTAACAAALAAALAACGGGGGSSSGAARSAAGSIAANPTVKADEQAAAKLIQGCLTAAHIADVKSCILGKVSKDKRTALGQCLARDAAGVVGRADARAKFAQGAQACVTTALAVPVPGASANIPGVTVTPGPSAS
jgi:hypothetical protein